MNKIFLSILLLLGLGYFNISYSNSKSLKENIAPSATNNQKLITVKYYGTVEVNDDNFQELELKPSSFVHEMYYDKNNNYLLVRLKNTYYHYCSIPSRVINDWASSSSLGRYYNSNIRGNYSCENKSVPQY